MCTGKFNPILTGVDRHTEPFIAVPKRRLLTAPKLKQVSGSSGGPGKSDDKSALKGDIPDFVQSSHCSVNTAQRTVSSTHADMTKP